MLLQALPNVPMPVDAFPVNPLALNLLMDMGFPEIPARKALLLNMYDFYLVFLSCICLSGRSSLPKGRRESSSLNSEPIPSFFSHAFSVRCCCIG